MSAIDMNRVIEAAENDEPVGFCKACGDESERVEPDARRYRCHACGALAVYGVEELLLGAF